MDDRILHERERALENAFFARQEEALLQRLREKDRMASRRAALAAASGITDDTVLDALAGLDLAPGSVAALALVPLVLVAWADGSLDAREAAAVRDAARESGLDANAEAAQLLDGWLSAPPGTQIEAAWRAYAGSVAASLAPEARAALKTQTLGRARRVAEAAGGVLGLGRKVSEAEERVLARLAEAFGG
jgi:hypothetical protein